MIQRSWRWKLLKRLAAARWQEAQKKMEEAKKQMEEYEGELAKAGEFLSKMKAVTLEYQRWSKDLAARGPSAKRLQARAL